MKLFLLLVVALFGHVAFATNMQIRACQLTASQFYIVGFQNTEDYADDQVGFCRYGSALIGSEAMMDKVFNHKISLAVKAFSLTQQTPTTDCGPATEISGYDLDDQHTITVCKYSDYSYIEKTTLINGYLAPENAKLVKALHLQF